jgi:hypothetical protein
MDIDERSYLRLVIVRNSKFFLYLHLIYINIHLKINKAQGLIEKKNNNQGPIF